MKVVKAIFIVILVVGLAALVWAQQPPAGNPPAQPPRVRAPVRDGIRDAYPQRPPAEEAVVARGKALYGVHCSFCHGSDARGGEGGPNLIRSQLVLNDQNGEAIAPVVQNGLPDRGMSKLDLTLAQISDIAAFIHSFRVGGYDASRQRPPSILVGDAKAGEAYFNAKCAACHSVTGDLKGFGAKFTDPKTLQHTWLMPGGGRGRFGGPPAPITVRPTTVTVILPKGQKVEGRLERIDDFIVTLTEADGTSRTFRREGETPKVEIHDPLQPHKELLRTYTDKDIHNLTAYLVTLK